MTDLEADLKIAQARIKELEAQIPKWISVEDRLPENVTDVLVHYTDGTITIDWWCRSLDSFMYENIYGDVTHWMPLPEAPKEE